MRIFAEEICRKLRHYVYLYIDPASGDVFYVGKGKGNRAFDHLDDRSESGKCDRIKAIRKTGCEPLIELLAHAGAHDVAKHRRHRAANQTARA